MNNEQQLEKIAQYSHAHMTQDRTGHGFDHIRRVVAMARKLSAKENADLLVTLASAYLHDVIDDKLVDDPKTALDGLKTFLSEVEVSAPQIEQILFIIQNMSFAHTLDNKPIQLPLEGQIVQDSDWLDAIGAIGVTRAIYFGGHHSEKIYDPRIKPRESMTKEEYRNLQNETIINHFYEKLLKIKDKLNTPSAKKIAENRQRFMLDFLTEFQAEWDAKK
ncbi:HD domain-containing protein [Ligilactobacillus pobuzihii]|uniref:HD domain-containing protein n=1 Tax=Ligilactobacillus pobuzihii TaxID=449659 RepID=UPI0019D2F30F|nr:HD domain-containing protein [Ligilactobacillus pobuzihii]MBN7274257.1 HD domain-containing protein [Ligilactobacillus pobuzihii]HIZ96335.1 HD domain-containing protein [Candidatus Ligilactobacillus excrementavium]